MKYYEAKATVLCGACANYNPDLGRGMIGHSRPVAYGPRALKRPRAMRDWSRMADHAPALGLDCIFSRVFLSFCFSDSHSGRSGVMPAPNRGCEHTEVRCFLKLIRWVVERTV